MIVITTPTGDIGHQVLASVAAGPEPVRVIIRDAEKIPVEIRSRVEVLTGSHADPTVIDRALTGADTLFGVVPPDFTAPEVRRRYVEFTRPAAAAIERQGVGHVVSVSALGRGYDGDSGLVTASIEMTGLLDSTGASTRALANPGFIENMLRSVGTIRTQGVFYGTLDGDRRLPFVSTRDIAAAASELLTDRGWLGHADVPPLGKEDLSQNEIAEITSDVLGQGVSYQQVPLDGFRSQMLERGASEAMVEAMAAMLDANDKGMDNLIPRTAENSTPTGYRQWAEEVLKPALQTRAA
jgi:uncharacterized protein YbjT (DUF2867 family)